MTVGRHVTRRWGVRVKLQNVIMTEGNANILQRNVDDRPSILFFSASTHLYSSLVAILLLASSVLTVNLHSALYFWLHSTLWPHSASYSCSTPLSFITSGYSLSLILPPKVLLLPSSS